MGGNTLLINQLKEKKIEINLSWRAETLTAVFKLFIFKRKLNTLIL